MTTKQRAKLCGCFLVLALVVPGVNAQWTEDAQQCATIEFDHKRAIHHCTVAINSGKLDRADLALTLNNRAYEYVETDQLELALADAKESVRLDNTNTGSWNQLGRVINRMEGCEAAIPYYLAAIERVTGNENLTVGYGPEQASK